MDRLSVLGEVGRDASSRSLEILGQPALPYGGRSHKQHRRPSQGRQGKERPWLSRVAVNCCRDLLRRRRYRRHEPLEAAEQLFAQPEDRELYTAVMELPEKERAAVSMRLHRGRKKLQAILKEDGYETAVSKDL